MLFLCYFYNHFTCKITQKIQYTLLYFVENDFESQKIQKTSKILAQLKIRMYLCIAFHESVERFGV